MLAQDTHRNCPRCVHLPKSEARCNSRNQFIGLYPRPLTATAEGPPRPCLPLEASPRVAAGTLIRPAIWISPGHFSTRPHDPTRGSPDRARDRCGAPTRALHRFAFRGARLRVGVHHRDSPRGPGARYQISAIGRHRGRFLAPISPGWRRIAPLLKVCTEGSARHLPNQYAARFTGMCLTTPRQAANNSRRQSRGPVFLTQAFRLRPFPNNKGNVINLIDQKVLRLDPGALLLHDCQVGSADRHANHGAGACPDGSG